ncbi:hypothetical protein QOT17_004949 [Balamuthia mandrillaris]
MPPQVLVIDERDKDLEDFRKAGSEEGRSLKGAQSDGALRRKIRKRTAAFMPASKSRRKRIGLERLKHNASERKRKWEFNARLEELRLLADLPPLASQRQIVEGAIGHIHELLSECHSYRQLAQNMDQRIELLCHPHGGHAQQHQHFPNFFLPTTTPADLSGTASPPFPILPPLHVVLSQIAPPSTRFNAPSVQSHPFWH